MVKIVMLFSILFNLLILGAGSILVYSKGGIDYLIRQLSFLQTPEMRATFMYDTPYYRIRKNHFKILPQSEADIVFLGDSITDACEWQELFKNVRIKNRGISGDTTKGILNRIHEVVESQPQKIFIMIGINDLTKGSSIDETFNNYQDLLNILQKESPKTKVFVQSVLPVNNQKYPNIGVNNNIINLNNRLRDLAQKLSFNYIDLFSDFLDSNNQLDAQYTTDGIHLNGQGYLLWKGLIEQEVMN
ncbi:GDSL-type esterase/lipase family protein [Allocoleopsis franciscana]|uniref:Lysophospholipase L1-like esterase n=1 Tax=Allocoleopsis franciscana PCC 7113 TaxID=1173027 RepID=K9WJ28_9CYAN|nr:GDSL-type esterase/lipase family protein [Allocoleopsis franciscana]AFZ19816.1 lysophospholipase L1-like esterase [Allocoleopsis franciscana PCC 7113]